MRALHINICFSGTSSIVTYYHSFTIVSRLLWHDSHLQYTHARTRTRCWVQHLLGAVQ
jgi:hypothetical protein